MRHTIPTALSNQATRRRYTTVQSTPSTTCCSAKPTRVMLRPADEVADRCRLPSGRGETECPCRSCRYLVELQNHERHQNIIDASAGVVEMLLVEVITHIHDHGAASVLPVEVAPVREDPALLVKPSLTQCCSQLLRPPGAGGGVAHPELGVGAVRMK